MSKCKFNNQTIVVGALDIYSSSLCSMRKLPMMVTSSRLYIKVYFITHRSTLTFATLHLMTCSDESVKGLIPQVTMECKCAIGK